MKVEIVDCQTVEFVKACMALWPGRELTVQVPAGVDEGDLRDTFIACGCDVLAPVENLRMAA